MAPIALAAIAMTIPTSVGASAPSTSKPTIGAGITYATGSGHYRAATPGGTGGNMTFHGGQLPFNGGVLPNPHMYLVFWGSAWNSDPTSAATMAAITTFATNLGGSGWEQTVAQYLGCGAITAPPGQCATPTVPVQNLSGQLKGSYVDTTSDPTPGVADTPGTTAGPISGANGAVERAIVRFGLDTNGNYIVLTPRGQNPSWFGPSNMCAYHSAIQYPAGAPTMATFSVVPYFSSAVPGCNGSGSVNGQLDAFTDAIAHEYSEAIVSPDASCGWSEGTGTCPGAVTTAAGGGEIADKCAGIAAGSVTLGGKPYALPYLWSNADSGCTLGAVTTGPPGAPTAVTATAGNASATVSWTPPSNSGGSAITGYKVTTNPALAASPFTVPAAPTALISGLTNGTAYTFTVKATNSSGDSPDSAPSAAVTPSAPQVFPGGGFTSVVPYRVTDTRPGSIHVGTNSTLGAGGIITVPVAGTGGQGGVPSTATAVVLNVTVVTPTASGYLTVWPAGFPKPTASNLNFTPGQVVPNLVEVALGQGGAVSFFNSGGSTDVIADVAGFTGPSGGDAFTPVTPVRLMDTRPDGPQKGPNPTLGSATIANLTIAGANSVPANASGVILNVTVTNTTGNSFLTIWPAGQTQPTASNLNFTPGQTVPNRVQVKLGGGAISIFNLSGNADVIVDLNGYFTSGAGNSFTGVTPTRLVDTRSTGQTLGSNGQLALPVLNGPASVPSGAKAVVLNVTVANPSNGGFVTAWPGATTKPTASDLNFTAGQVVPNLVVVGVGSDGKVNFFNLSGSVDLIVDIAGWYS